MSSVKTFLGNSFGFLMELIKEEFSFDLNLSFVLHNAYLCAAINAVLFQNDEILFFKSCSCMNKNKVDVQKDNYYTCTTTYRAI